MWAFATRLLFELDYASKIMLKMWAFAIRLFELDYASILVV